MKNKSLTYDILSHLLEKDNLDFIRINDFLKATKKDWKEIKWSLTDLIQKNYIEGHHGELGNIPGNNIENTLDNSSVTVRITEKGRNYFKECKEGEKLNWDIKISEFQARVKYFPLAISIASIIIATIAIFKKEKVNDKLDSNSPYQQSTQYLIPCIKDTILILHHTQKIDSTHTPPVERSF